MGRLERQRIGVIHIEGADDGGSLLQGINIWSGVIRGTTLGVHHEVEAAIWTALSDRMPRWAIVETLQHAARNA